MKTGGQLIVDALEANGVDRIFCVPGKSYLAVLDALYDSPIRTVVCRQEGGAAMMADCAGRLTGQPGICIVTRGPGATNASAGLHIARQDSIPMILFIGQVPARCPEREAFQEIDYSRFFGDIAKWVGEIDDARAHPGIRDPRLCRRDLGPARALVVISLPEDMLTQKAEAPRALPYQPVETHPGRARSQQLEELLAQSRATDRHSWRHALERRGRRTVPALRRALGRCRSAAPSAARCCSTIFIPTMPAMSASAPTRRWPSDIREADLVLLVGGRMGEMPSSGYTLLEEPLSATRRWCMSIPTPGELGRVYRPTLAINASPAAFRRSARRAEAGRALPVDGPHRGCIDAYLAWSTPPETGPGAVQMGPIMALSRERAAGGRDHLPTAPAITPHGCIASTASAASPRRRAPTSGSMGYGVPAAVAAKHLFPEREVICLAGDGCFLMHGQEFATAVQYGLPVIVIVVNNGIYGTIRMHQERDYPGRVIGTDLDQPGFRGACPRLWRPRRDGRDRRRNSRRPSSARARAASRRSSRSSSIPKRSRRRAR